MEDPPPPRKEPVPENVQEAVKLIPSDKSNLKGHHLVLTDKAVYNLSLWAVKLGLLADSINNTILRPNYPFLVLPGSHPVRYIDINELVVYQLFNT